jgi:tRNA-guanine family transglycosylase
MHNLHFYLDLMRQAREQIENCNFEEFRKRFVANYKTRDAELAKVTNDEYLVKNR